ncbi:hypothetical protein B1R32_10119 [Abditibacterium utsteinense]|uniref:Uncharacterized protein n=2 Tax=Abditibacterium utsteinense TaxID=1960156 RepID=A0A2S8SWV5_9BACT|nr:hypothetical protein B1R32_10119 [Abditibacterium utsteinense]
MVVAFTVFHRSFFSSVSNYLSSIAARLMSPVTPTPLAPRAQKARFSFKDSPWRPAVCCAGALGIGLSLAPLMLRPQAVRVEEEAASEIVLPQESTLVVTPTLPPGALLRGQIRLVADVLGRAQVDGEVARHLVETGTRVQRGDAVLEISSGVATRAVPLSESRQNRAEQGQIAAADAQTALSQKIAAAQTRLRDAQQRVGRSQTQVGAARDIVRRLQNGAVVASAEIPAPFRGESPQIEPFRLDKPRKRRLRRAARPAEAVNRAALRQAEAAREVAKNSGRELQSAQKTLIDAQNSVREADDKLQSTLKNVTDVEARFGAKKASGADVETARDAQKQAQQAVNSADKALLAAKAEVVKREKSAATAQSNADSAASQAAKSLSAARLDLDAGATSNEENSAEPVAPESSEERVKSGRVTLDQAIRFAGVALDESRRASRDAERIHAQIEGYQSQVTNSQSRVESATQNLVSAQQKVLDSVPRPRFTASYAPADGVVMWISRLAREVGAGQAVFGLARGEKVAAHFEDKSGLWRSVKKDATLPAFVVDPSSVATASVGTANTPDAKPTSSIQTGAGANSVTSGKPSTKADALSAGFPVEVKITEIESPAAPGAAATLTAEVHGAPGTGGAASLRAGAAVLIPMPRPHQKATLSVPISALMQRGGVTYLAVLSPMKAEERPISASFPLKNDAPQKMKAAATEAADAEQSQKFHLGWQRVETGRSDGLRLEITAGLQAGTRVVAQPEQLEAMGFAPVLALQAGHSKSNGVSGTASTLSDRESATSNGEQKSQTPVEVLVRLSPTLT